jgi:small subunit ribosomal protein S24e
LELKIKQEEYNALLKRKEISAEVEHDKTGTPSRIELRKAIASKYEVKPESVYVIGVQTKMGTQSAICEIQVYDDTASALRIVPKYIQTRNLPPEERKHVREQEAKKSEAKPKPEKPKEKPKEEKPQQEAKPAAEPPKKPKEPAPK